MHEPNRAIRGHIVTLTGDPFVAAEDEVLVEHTDGLILIENGTIAAVGPYADLAASVPDGVPVDHYPHAIISAGFVDTHIHYVQTGIIAAFGAQLIDWLNEYTFVEEQRFADKVHASMVAKIFFDQLLANGTTTALTFCAVYPDSVDAFFEEATRRNMLMAGGKVMMDRNAPSGLLDTAQTGYDDSKALIERWHGTGRNLYAVTPRFAPTSTEAELEAAAALRREHPGVLMHTHVSENLGEIAWVKSLFPDRAGYLDVYDHAGLLGPGAVLAHGVHLTAAERMRCVETGTAVSHCPTSNLFLGSGLFHIHQAKNPKSNLTVGLGTDIGAGTSFSLLATMNEAYKVAQLTQYPLDAIKMFYLATLGGAQALGVQDRIGSIEVGKAADLVVLDTRATDLLAFRSSQVDSLEEQLFVLSVMGDDRTVQATYIAGEIAHTRDR
ncbi:guanine deaminase [Paeniglutamicibacter kerguelensis]|uniref:Guanine deaminase n=1 Tax=Paeniglutamicibacter kerguelensis TaxID=254788 RepID=A0ABS4XHG1_9MICC|nr:guanine deaminase [Paeniglutamicibacter kerguelensis]MBP2387746.1 guanine deaminase [Paeniglutamicibacter kerguelensis]